MNAKSLWCHCSCRLQALALGAVLLWAVPAFSLIQEQGRSQDKGSSNQDALLLPNHKGADLARQLCGSCHSVATFTGLRRSRDAWEITVSDMINRGALIRNDEFDPVVDYLASVFGPASPPLLDANSALQDDLERLPGLDPQAVRKLLDYRKQKGPLQDITQVKSILGAVEFEEIKGYLIVKQPPTPADR